jgi:acyl-CoA thioesterase-1
MQYFVRFSSILFLFLFLMPGCKNPDKESEKTENTEKEQPIAEKTSTKKSIVFFGNSITAAYGLEESQGFPALIQQKLDSLHLPYQTLNAGNSGETTQGGKSRISWVLEKPVDIFMLELGGNDGLRGIDLKTTRQNLQAIMDSVKTHYPDCKIILAGMQIPPNLGKDYTTQFEKIYPELASKNKVTLLPFLLEGVAGKVSLNQADGIHPTAAGQKILASNVWKVLEPLLVR